MSRAGEGGFTLIEAMVALAIMGLAVLSITAAAARALRVEAATLDHLEAVALADAKMSEIASLPYAALEPWSTPRSGTFADGNERFGWTAEVAAVPESPRLFRTVVRVSWSGGAVELAGVVYRPARVGAATGVGP